LNNNIKYVKLRINFIANFKWWNIFIEIAVKYDVIIAKERLACRLIYPNNH